MTAWPVLASLPPEVEVLDGTRGVLAVVRQVRAELLAAGFGPEGGEALAASDVSGRTRLDELVLADGTRALVRRFTHGGLARVVTGERYGDPQRPFRELVHASRLRAAGLPTPEVLAARALRASGFGWNLALVTRRLERVQDFAVVLEARRRGEGTLAGWRSAVRAVGRLVGRLHGVGFLHADLHPRNLLLSEDALAGAPPLVHVLDIDRSRFVERLTARARRRNLARLRRAVSKREERGAAFLTRGDHLRFLRGYEEGLGRHARDRDSWRDDWRGARASGVASAWLHSLGWRLERWFGGGAAARDGDALVRAELPPDD